MNKILIKRIGVAVLIWLLGFAAFLLNAEILPKNWHDGLKFLLIGPPLLFLGHLIGEGIIFSLNAVFLFFFPSMRRKSEEIAWQTRDQSFSMRRIFWSVLYIIFVIGFFGSIIWLYQHCVS